MRALATFFRPPAGIGDTRPSFSPELNASVAARHSRAPEGLDHILQMIDKAPSEDAAIDTVFKHVDYGHRSICDMAPLSIHIEGISVWMAELIWTLVSTGGGQETSTRYSKMDAGDTYMPDSFIGILKAQHNEVLARAIETYEMAVKFWEQVALGYPTMVGLTGDEPPSKADRFRRNFVFDRSRYFIPMGCKTNMNVTTWGTEWIKIVSALASSPWQEAQEVAAAVLAELKLGAPRLIRHTGATEAWRDVWRGRLFSPDVQMRAMSNMRDFSSKLRKDMGRQFKIEDVAMVINSTFPFGAAPILHIDTPFLEPLKDEAFLAQNLLHRTSRYDPVGKPLECIPVVYGWNGVANAEIRDMNRHRPGVRNFHFSPRSFYFAQDQILEVLDRGLPMELSASLEALVTSALKVGANSLDLALQTLTKRDASSPDFIYSTLLGHTFDFEHTSTLGHLIYECELRTGPGTHFRYRKHYQDLLAALETVIPNLRKFTLEGSGKPE